MPAGLLLPEERSFLEKKLAYLIFQNHTNLIGILSDHVLSIDVVQPPKLYAERVIIYCEQSGWTENPALILKLLINWKAFVEMDAAIRRIRELPPPIFFPNGRPWETCHVAVNLPFIGREKARKMPSEFMNPLVSAQKPNRGTRVLVVNGPQGSGKTHTLKYLEYQCLVTPTFKVASLDYGNYISSWFGPKELTEAILDKISPQWRMGESLPALDVEQPARWRIQLANFIAKRLGENQEVWFIVLDQFDAKTVPSDTIEFIQLLAEVATGSKFSDDVNDRLRLVLLGFTGSIQDFEKRVVIEDIEPMTREDLAKYFRQYITYKQINIEVTNNAIIDFLVDRVLSKNPGNVPARTKILAQLAMSVALETEISKKN